MEQYEEGGTEEVTPEAVERSTKETAVPQEMAVRQEMAAPQEVIHNQENAMPEQEKAEKQATNPGKKKKAVKASLSWAPPERETRHRRLTERYGIDVIMSVEDEKNASAKGGVTS